MIIFWGDNIFFLEKCIPIWPKLHNERHVLQLGNLKIEQFFFCQYPKYFDRYNADGHLLWSPSLRRTASARTPEFFSSFFSDSTRRFFVTIINAHQLYICQNRYFGYWRNTQFLDFFFDTTVTVVVPNSYLGVTIELIQAVRVGIYVNMVFKVIHG